MAQTYAHWAHPGAFDTYPRTWPVEPDRVRCRQILASSKFKIFDLDQQLPYIILKLIVLVNGLGSSGWFGLR